MLVATAGLIGISYLALFTLLKLPLVSQTQPLDAKLPDQVLSKPGDALTFAYAGIAGKPHLLLVTELEEDGAKAIDLNIAASGHLATAFDAIDHFGRDALIEMVEMRAGEAQSYAQSEFLPVVRGAQHIAFGTNFADHGSEVENETPFHFPRLNEPTASISDIAIDPALQMVDYEVELCMSLDRPVASREDFAAARKQIFLCADFTDRKVMLNGMPEAEKTLSGIGFSDAKSLPGYFPTGPYTVIPKDWRAFLQDEIIATSRNGAPMQWTKGGQMILDFEAMAAEALASGDQKKWTYKNEPVALLPSDRIEPGQVLLSGTTEGVLFRPPSSFARVVLGAKYAMTGAFLSGQSGYRYVLIEVINRSIDNKVMLMPGDEVVHHSKRLGKIVVKMVAK